MYIVSGCSRSGTSLMMDILRVALGEDRIFGYSFPQADRLEIERHENEPDNHYEARKYMASLSLDNLEESKDMNPNGFFETKYAVQGIRYSFSNDDEQQERLKDIPPKVCKIVSPGLSNSDPRFVDKVIFMLRHPRSVAKSQERLIRRDPSWKNFLERETDGIIHTPMMFIDVSIRVAQWFKKYKKPYIIVEFDELVENPEREVMRIKEFLGEDGNWKESFKRVNPKLRRSMPEEIPNSLWGEAELIYNSFRENNFEPIIDFVTNWNTFFNREYGRFMCSRIMETVSYHHCELCLKSKNYKELLKRSADQKLIDWHNEPCIYQTCKDITRPNITLEETIKRNHWND